ncbi:hypothetical protein [Paenibacillus gorillae]|uniref:hypothetical protein n=1 Tax=Paenibacillus gorillae TaxID=1243662 RepID=UPI0005AA828C|nr:hypothetical protein [Paenibacillus gorillae]
MISNQPYMQQSAVQPEYYQQMKTSPNQAHWGPQMIQSSPNQTNWGPQATHEQPVLPSHNVDFSQMHQFPHMFDYHYMHHYHPMMDDYHPMMHEMWDDHMLHDYHHDGWEIETLDYHHTWIYPTMHVHHHLHYPVTCQEIDEFQKKAAAHQP